MRGERRRWHLLMKIHSLSNEQNDFYPIRCWFIYNVLAAWRICGKAGKYVTSHVKTPKHTISNETGDQSLLDSKKQGTHYSCQQQAFVRKGPLPLVLFSWLSFPLKELTSVWASVWNSNLWVIFSWMAETALNSSSNTLGAFPFGLTSSRARPQARPPFSAGKQLKAWNLWSFQWIWIKTKQNKRLYMFYICAKGTLTGHWVIWTFNHKAKVKTVLRFLFFRWQKIKHASPFSSVVFNQWGLSCGGALGVGWV